MKTIFYKAKSYWKDGEDSTWELHSDFAKDLLYQKLKDEQDSIRDIHKNYIALENDTLFLFYRKGGKDFSGRDYVEIVALRSVKSFNNNNTIHEILTNNIQDVFDDFWEYEVEVDDSYIVKNRNHAVISKDDPMFTRGKKYILFFSILLALFYIFKLFDYTSIESEKLNKSVEEKVTNVAPIRRENIIGSEQRKNKVAKLESDLKNNQKKSWQWEEFCSKYTAGMPSHCYQKYIVEKCEKKEDFSYTYEEFVLNNKEKKHQDKTSISCEGIEEIQSDKDLTGSSIWIDHKMFFTE